MSNHRLTEIIQSISHEADEHQVDIGEILVSFAKQGFGILLVLPCVLLIIPPIGAIPGVPFLLGLYISILSIQLIFGVRQPWVPRKIMSVKIKTSLLKKSIEGILPLTRKIDAYTKQRLQILFTFPMVNLVGFLCLCPSVTMMIIGFIPFLPLMVGVIVLFFGIGLAVGDGLFLCMGVILNGLMGMGVYYFTQ